jgi:hypothetical protein
VDAGATRIGTGRGGVMTTGHAMRGTPSRPAEPDAFATAADVRAQVERLRVRLERVRRTRQALVALAVAFMVGTLLALLGRVTAPVGGALWPSVLPVVLGAMAGAAAFVALRARSTPITPVRAALWFEERFPRGHAVVTLVDHGALQLDDRTQGLIARQAALPRSGVELAPEALRAAASRAWRRPAAAAVLALALFVATLVVGGAAPRASASEASSGVHVGAAGTPDAMTGSRLAPWQVEVVPPSYAARTTRVLEDSGTVTALAGSRIRLSGRGAAAGLAVRLLQSEAAVDSLPVGADSARWFVSLTMPARPVAVRVSDGDVSRTLALVPIADSLPVVVLRAPVRDSVYRDSVGAITLAADARDDLGLASVVFELIVTSGAGERYTARTVQFGRRALGGEVRAEFSQRVTFEELGLASGDIVHLRAVARDRHPAAAREAGVSETRSLRIARADEYDSVAVDAAPPPAVDSSLLSQRMLLMLTERLEARRPQLARELLVSESRRLAAEQARIRRAVSAIVFQRLSGDGESEHVHYEGDGHDHGLIVQAGKLVPSPSSQRANVMPGATPPPSMAPQIDMSGGESPIVGVNRPLLEAYNHMWDAGRALELADPAAAIPPMRLALEAIQRARAAERVYLRGRARAVVVDIARVRLAGRDTGQASSRRPGDAVAAPPDAFDRRLLRAVGLLPSAADAGRDSLLALRLDALAEMPPLARALETALAQLERGEDATDALVRARRTLAMPERSSGLSTWRVP